MHDIGIRVRRLDVHFLKLLAIGARQVQGRFRLVLDAVDVGSARVVERVGMELENARRTAIARLGVAGAFDFSQALQIGGLFRLGSCRLGGLSDLSICRTRRGRGGRATARRRAIHVDKLLTLVQFDGGVRRLGNELPRLIIPLVARVEAELFPRLTRGRAHGRNARV